MVRELIAIPFPTRIGRLSYLIRAFPLQIWQLHLLDEMESNQDLLRPVILSLLLLVYLTLFVNMPRMYDAGMRKIWVFLTLVPFVSYVVGIFLLFKSSDAGIGRRRVGEEGPEELTD